MAKIPKVDSKDPSEVLDYQIDMTAELKGRGVAGANDAITGATFTLPSGLTLVGLDFDTNTATAVISGGTLGQEYTVAAVIETANGRTYHRSFRLKIETR